MIEIQRMQPEHWLETAALVHDSTNAWYEQHFNATVFPGPAEDCLRFCETYETLDPGCTVIAVDTDSGRIAGCCFLHPRQTHVSLGILNVHPDFFGHGVARALIDYIIDFAEREGKPLRLVSSAMNLDSFSLYSRCGFVPYVFFQDMIIDVPDSGFDLPVPEGFVIRDAVEEDAPAMAALEMHVQGIYREKDFRFFVENKHKRWTTSVLERASDHKLTGFLVSIDHPGTTMMGPGCMIDSSSAVPLIVRELNRKKGASRTIAVPSGQPLLVQFMYTLSARNIETHIAQCRGEFQRPVGVVLPCYLPETN